MKRLIKLLSAIGFAAMALCVTPAFAADKTSKVKLDPKELIGKEVIGTKYPNGWKRRGGGALLHSKDYDFAELSRGTAHALVLEKRLSQSEQTGTSSAWKILDAVSLKGPPRKGVWYDLTGDCRGPEGLVNKEAIDKKEIVLVEVVFKKCARYSGLTVGALAVLQ